MKLVHLVAMLAILQFIVFSFLVGRAREQYGIKAPAISGNENFERAFRVQMNTLEQLVCFLPALLVAAQYWSGLIVALLGLVYLVGRVLYRQAYVKDPSGRTTGFLLTLVPTVILLLMGITGALFRTPV